MPTRRRSEAALGQMFYDTASTPVRGLNCTEMYSKVLSSGYYNGSGKYSGLLGMLQRDEIDYAFQIVRTDAIIDDNIYAGPAVYSGSSYIISKTLKFKNVNIEVADVVRHFTMVAWEYLGIICFVVSVVSSFMYATLSRKTSTVRDVALVGSKQVWNYFEILTAQGMVARDHVSTSIAWVVTSLGTFIIVSGYLLNFMSCDQVAQEPQPLIDSLEAQLSPNFRHVGPTVFNNFFLYQKLIKPEPGTQLYVLAQLIKEKGKFIDAEASAKKGSLDNMYRLIDEIDRGKKTMISESVFWDLISHRVLCASSSTKVIDVIVSQPFNEGVLTYFFNKRLPGEVIRYLDYHARNAVELGVTNQRVVSSASYMIASYFNDNYDTMRCYTGLRDDEMDSLEFVDAGIPAYKSTFFYCVCALAVSFSALVVEMSSQWMSSGRIQPMFEQRHS
ncbi:hypothetical protein HDE_07833 [Halotydeus destructor]|nr:hypothetical protein HDE_07833 [Halotydeus destructor]